MPAKPLPKSAATPPAMGVSGIPRRHSLVDQSLTAIKARITSRHWEQHLPSEETMRSQLNISRVTLRKALALLMAQGWIHSQGKGKPHRIASDNLPPVAAAIPPGTIVRCLSPVPELEMVYSSRVILDEIKNTLAAHGLRFEWAHHASLWRGEPAKRLEQVMGTTDTAGWMLFRANPWLQQAFSENHQPCLVLGPTYPGVSLPSVQVDNAALGRHAAAEARRLGHQHLAWVAYDIDTASSLQTLEGLQTLPAAGDAPTRVSIVADDLTTEGLRQSLIKTLTKHGAPTVLMLMTAAQVLPVMGILRELGLRVPEDISLIVRDHEPFLDRCVPLPHRYSFDWQQFGRSAARLLLANMTSGPGAHPVKKLLPVFLPGDTLAHSCKS